MAADDDLTLLLLAGAGVAAFFFFTSRAQASIGPGGGAIGTAAAPGLFGGTPAMTSPTLFAGSPTASPTSPTMWGGSPASSPAPAGFSPMQVSGTGRAFIQREEGLSLRIYPDAGQTDIGYGHKWRPGDPTSITASQALEIFNGDIAAVENTLNNSLRVPVTQGQFDALADLCYNIGAGEFLDSSLLAAVNAGDYAGAAAQFPLYNHSGGQVSAVLTARRAGDRQMWFA